MGDGKSDVWWQSPSTRREWIEILSDFLPQPDDLVSLHTEGVD